jgi:myo-inositol catabolism protein IolC
MTDHSGPSFQIPETVLYREVAGEMVLLNLDTEQYFGLNGVGADIVTRLVKEPRDQALAALCDYYEVDVETLHRDVEDLVESLVRAGLLTRVEHPG